MTSFARVFVGRSFLLHSGRSVCKTLGPCTKGQFRTSGTSPSLCRPLSNYADTASRYQRSRYSADGDDGNEYDVEDDVLEELRKQHRTQATSSHVAAEGGTFTDFPLNERLLRQLDKLGYSNPFEIQVATLKHTLDDRDVIAKALTGSGKTLAFSIPIVHKLLERSSRGSSRSPKAIVISPTRELCLQIYRSIEELDPRVRCVAVYGGASLSRQEQELRKGVDVICATPGRLNDHLQRGIIDLKELEFLCLDEADELLTPGFKEQIEDVLENSPRDKQVMLFSATMPPEIKSITRQYMNDPVYVDITKNQKYKAPDSVKHLCMRVPTSQQIYVVKSLIDEHQPERTIVFMETKQKTRDAANFMRRQLKLRAEGINSDLSQSRRENVMAAFRAGKIDVLVATDVAARGLDIPEVDLVIQVSPPKNGTDYYIHRSGRTGRAGREGLSVLLHSGHPSDWGIIKEIERLAKIEHTKPPNQDEMVNQSAKLSLAMLEKKKYSKLTESLLPLVEDLDIGGDDGQRLLAAALGTIVRGSGDEPATDYGSSYQRNNYRERNSKYSGRTSNKRQYRSLSSDDYEDSGSNQRGYRRGKQSSDSFYSFDD